MIPNSDNLSRVAGFRSESTDRVVTATLFSYYITAM